MAVNLSLLSRAIIKLPNNFVVTADDSLAFAYDAN